MTHWPHLSELQFVSEAPNELWNRLLLPIAQHDLHYSEPETQTLNSTDHIGFVNKL